jgi:RND superfamily putative drug exporter
MVLLLVFHSPLAAAIPLVSGAATVVVARGVIYLVAPHLSIDGFALTVCSMMGLALGVDYTLLMVSRFREELKVGAAPLDAAWRTRRTAGRTTVFAGLTVALAMVVTLWVMPGNLFLSLAGRRSWSRRLALPSPTSSLRCCSTCSVTTSTAGSSPRAAVESA